MKMLTPKVPLALPRKLLAEHSCMFAPAGHGKTQALQALILGWLKEPDPPAMFIIDSHGDMLRTIERLALFNTTLKDRLVIIDPEDATPPALNFLDFSGNEASVAELFTYLMSALSSDLTSKRSTVMAFILRLMAAIPNATSDTLRLVMEDNAKTIATSKFADVIATLDPIAQDFFTKQFYAPGSMGVTKQAIARRIYALLANPTFQTMFSSSKNRFNAFEAMQQKKIVLINTSMKLLRADASSVFGRYMIAQIRSRSFLRDPVPRTVAEQRQGGSERHDQHQDRRSRQLQRCQCARPRDVHVRRIPPVHAQDRSCNAICGLPEDDHRIRCSSFDPIRHDGIGTTTHRCRARRNPSA